MGAAISLTRLSAWLTGIPKLRSQRWLVDSESSSDVTTHRALPPHIPRRDRRRSRQCAQGSVFAPLRGRRT